MGDGGARKGEAWEMEQREAKGDHTIRAILSDFLLKTQVNINVNGFDGEWCQRHGRNGL